MRPLAPSTFCALTVILFAGTAATGRAQQRPDTAAAAPRRLIVTFADRSFDLSGLRAAIRSGEAERVAAVTRDLRARVEVDRRAFRGQIEQLGGRMIHAWWIIDGCAIELPAGAVREVERLPGVRRVFDDQKRGPGTAPIKVSTDNANHHADAVQAAGVRGAGVTVAVLDTGFDSDMNGIGRPHRTFFVNGDPNNQTGGGLGGSRMLANTKVGLMPPDNAMDHGTKVASVAIGASWNTTAQSDDGHAPRAKIAGYSLSDDAQGFSFLSTMVQAWQQVAADAVRFDIKVANISYEGTLDPSWPEQQAMDAAAATADLLVAAMGGNSAGNQSYFQGAVNVLTAGAVDANAHTVAAFSAIGPLRTPGLMPRIYPLVVANGVGITTPTADAENVNVTSSGTSYGAPQTAGAAALFRSVKTGATADETRAAILATTADVTLQNPSALGAIGHGYLRDDALVALANGTTGTVTTGRVGLVSPVAVIPFSVAAGKSYAVALSWSRQSVTAAGWANLDLRVRLGGVLLGESRGVHDSNERVAFRARATGTAQIEVVAAAFEPGTTAQSFGLAAAESTSPVGTAAIESFGAGCPVSHGAPSVLRAEPDALAPATFGNTRSDLLLGNVDHRTLQWIASPPAPLNAFHVRGLAFRHDDQPPHPAQRYWVEIDVDLGLTTRGPAMITTTFDQSYDSIRTRVFSRKRVVLPAQSAPNVSPGNWSVVLPLDQAFHRVYDPRPAQHSTPVQNLIVDVRKYGSSIGAASVPYFFDAHSGAAVGNTLFAPSPTATIGTITTGLVTVVGLIDALGNAVVPAIAGSGTPALGGQYRVDLQRAPAAAQVGLATGLSNQLLLGTALPLSLAPLGAAGCFVLTSQDIVTMATASAMGTASFPMPVPPNQALIGGRLYHQVIVLEPNANPFGAATTNGLTVTVGR